MVWSKPAFLEKKHLYEVGKFLGEVGQDLVIPNPTGLLKDFYNKMHIADIKGLLTDSKP